MPSLWLERIFNSCFSTVVSYGVNSYYRNYSAVFPKLDLIAEMSVTFTEPSSFMSTAFLISSETLSAKPRRNLMKSSISITPSPSLKCVSAKAEKALCEISFAITSENNFFQYFCFPQYKYYFVTL